MTGLELLEGLSFVDERYIAEAETAKLGRNVPWMKVLSVAACLCILITGVLAYGGMFRWGATEEAAAPAAPMAQAPQAAEPEAAPEEAAPLMPSDTAIEESAAEETAATDELHNIPYARLRVVKILEDGSFEAIVEADEPMEMDTQVTVVVDPSKVPGADKDAYGGGFLAVAEGDLLEISNGAYDAEQNILYVSHVLILCD